MPTALPGGAVLDPSTTAAPATLPGAAPDPAATPPIQGDPARISALTDAYKRYVGADIAPGTLQWELSRTDPVFGGNINNQVKAIAQAPASIQNLGYDPTTTWGIGGNSSSGDVQGALGSFLASKVDPALLYGHISSQLGIPDVRTNVTNLRRQVLDLQNSIDQVAPNLQGRTQNSLVTQPQLDRLINMEKQPLLDSLTKQQASLGVATTNLNDLTSEADKQLGFKTADETGREGALKDLYTMASDREKEAEAVRQFNVAAAAKASGGSGGSGGGSGSKAKTDTQKGAASYDQIVNQINSDVKSGVTWAQVARNIAAAGYDPSNFDQAIKRAIGVREGNVAKYGYSAGASAAEKKAFA